MKKLLTLMMLALCMLVPCTVQAAESSKSFDVGVYFSCPATQIDEVKPSEPPKDKDQFAGSVGVQTGDTTNVALFVILAVLASAGVVVITKCR